MGREAGIGRYMSSSCVAPGAERQYSCYVCFVCEIMQDPDGHACRSWDREIEMKLLSEMMCVGRNQMLEHMHLLTHLISSNTHLNLRNCCCTHLAHGFQSPTCLVKLSKTRVSLSMNARERQRHRESDAMLLASNLDSEQTC